MKIKSALRAFASTLDDAILGFSTLGSRLGNFPELTSAHDDSFCYKSKSYYL